MFSIAPIGLALTAAGTLFVLIFGRLLIPTRKGHEEAAGRFRLDGYFTELEVLETSPFLDLTAAEVEAYPKTNVRVVGWMREGRHLPRPFGAERVRSGDVLIVRTTPEQIIAFREQPGNELRALRQLANDAESIEQIEDLSEHLTQAVVAPGSEIVGRSLRELKFHGRYGAIVVGLWRKSAWLREEIASVKLREGDVLVLMASTEALSKIQGDPGFLLLVPFHGETQLRQKAPLAALIMIGAVLATVFQIMSIEMAALTGAVLTVLFRCLTVRQAYRAIDTRIYVFIAGAVPLGLAMKDSGSADLMALWLKSVVAGWDKVWVLAALFATAGVMTQFMSDAATTALFAPLAIALAAALGHSPEAYVVTVAMASVVSFLTPIGHHGNLLVYAPGGYQFTDFARVGTPLTIIAGAIVVTIAPVLWP
jgi:di/tricarboxylate transporter